MGCQENNRSWEKEAVGKMGSQENGLSAENGFKKM